MENTPSAPGAEPQEEANQADSASVSNQSIHGLRSRSEGLILAVFWLIALSLVLLAGYEVWRMRSATAAVPTSASAAVEPLPTRQAVAAVGDQAVAVELRGFRMGAGRQPLSEKHRAALGKLEKTLGSLLAEEGFGRETAAMPAAGNFDPQQIGDFERENRQALGLPIDAQFNRFSQPGINQNEADEQDTACNRHPGGKA